MEKGKHSFEGLESYETGYEEGYNQGFEDCKNIILEFMKDFIRSHTSLEVEVDD